ncbi:ATP-binding cassette domain-containing protein [Streptomyces sp. NPDC020965]|uniref:ATP-binding cassette domain-containing protein n=1 Tax=Streptomyces sp. NPDC020965 TaxID=3365105 RepID=UPI0037A37173
MLQAIGLTSDPRGDLPPAVDDLTFEARPGQVTALLGAPGAGKTTALRLMLGREAGRGVTYFRGIPLHRVAHPAREVGVLLGDAPGHPGRSCRGRLRMLCAAAGVPLSRADEVLEAVGLAGLAQLRLGTLSRGMDRRLGFAAALVGDPQTLVTDELSRDLLPRDHQELYALARAHAERGGTVLCAMADPKEAARLADRVVTIDAGRLVADQDAADFARTRLRPRVAVRTPYAARLADLVHREARAARRSVEVAVGSSGLLAVYGSTCAEVGEAAFRHGVLVHRLTDEVGDTAPRAPEPASPTEGPVAAPAPHPALPPRPAGRAPRPADRPPRTADRTSCPAPSPVRPLRYELLRLFGTRTAVLVVGAVVIASLALGVLLARSRETPVAVALTAWPELLPLPPAALGAGVIGALSFGEEFRYPVPATVGGNAARRFGLLLAKLAVTAATALLIALLVVVADAHAIRAVYGVDAVALPESWAAPLAAWCGLCVGCAWAGLLGAGVFRVTAAGVAAVLAVPVAIAPLVEKALVVPSARSVAGLPGRLRELAWVRPPRQVDGWLTEALRAIAQPVGLALVVSLSVLICAYVFTGLRRTTRW